MKVSATYSAAPFPDLAEFAGRLEDSGAHAFYLAELTHDPFPGIAVAATGSRNLTFGTSIALAFTRSPTTLAYTAHDLMTVTGGRFVLGLGPQVRPHIERRFGFEWSEPVQRLKETVLAMRAVWTAWEEGGPLNFEGEIFNLSLMPPVFRPEANGLGFPPVYLAAVGPKMAEMAGEVADGLFVHAFSTPEYMRQVLLPAIERGLARSGRTRDDFEICYSAFHADAKAAGSVAAAKDQVRNSIAFYASTPDYRRVLEVHGLADLQPRLRQMTRDGAWDRMGAEIGDDMLDLFCVTGSPGEICAGIASRWGDIADQLLLTADYWERHEGNREWREGVEALSGLTRKA